MELTEFTPDHCVEVLAFWENMPGVGLNESDTPDALREFLKRNPGLSVIARESSDIVGAVLCGHDGRRGYLHHLAVAIGYRNQGIATRIIDRCRLKLQSIGIPKCNVFVYEVGKAFWERRGFGNRSDLRIMQARTGD